MSDFLGHDVDVVAELMEKAELQGYLTMDDVIEVFPDPEERVDEVEEVFIRLNEAGIEVYDEKEDVETAIQPQLARGVVKQAALSPIALVGGEVDGDGTDDLDAVGGRLPGGLLYPFEGVRFTLVIDRSGKGEFFPPLQVSQVIRP